eukprot:m.12203 g.12203  ORF g.12203 m.12203 type:complete len:287 (+) comp3965_c0_seq1:91-951(+)
MTTTVGTKEMEVKLLDPSDFRPELKDVKEFRDFQDSKRIDIVRETYQKMYRNQCVNYVKKMHEKWCSFDHAQMTIMDALEELNKLVDDSDPDVDVPNIFHAFQTAERIREKHPDNEWFQFVGLIHDLGKVMALWGQPQWSTVGDTFPVGCEFSNKIVFHEMLKDNPDYNNEELSSKNGMYKEGCGLDNVLMSWGHDEYLYQVLKHNKSIIPEEGLFVIRFHSFYPWHLGGAYKHLMNEKDEKMFQWIKEFNQFDLYSKSDAEPDMKKLRPYYQTLCDKFCPGEIKW